MVLLNVWNLDRHFFLSLKKKKQKEKIENKMSYIRKYFGKYILFKNLSIFI